MYVTPINVTPAGNGNGGIVPPWFQTVRDIILPIPAPKPLEPTEGTEVIGGPITDDPYMPVIM